MTGGLGAQAGTNLQTLAWARDSHCGAYCKGDRHTEHCRLTSRLIGLFNEIDASGRRGTVAAAAGDVATARAECGLSDALLEQAHQVAADRTTASQKPPRAHVQQVKVTAAAALALLAALVGVLIGALVF